MPGCEICGETRNRVVGVRGRHDRPVRNVVCLRCGLVYVSPLPSPASLKEFYEREYRSIYSAAGTEPTAAFLEAQIPTVQERLDFSKPYLSEGLRVLEIGCGTGHFLSLLRKTYSCAVVGLEPGPYGEYARRKEGIDVHTGFLEDAAFEAASFDVVALWHVVEHFPHPQEALARIRNWLRPTGVLLLEVPNLRRWCREVRFQMDEQFFQDAHLFSFTERTLLLLLRRAGFAPVGVDVDRSPWTHLFVAARPDRFREAKDLLSDSENGGGDDWREVVRMIDYGRGTRLERIRHILGLKWKTWRRRKGRSGAEKVQIKE